jgi:DNA-binding CsgD family transcriptional regulator
MVKKKQLDYGKELRIIELSEKNYPLRKIAKDIDLSTFTVFTYQKSLCLA